MKNGQYGAALVEFALILPFLLVLTLTVTEFGRAMHEYNLVTKSVRDGVRYLSIQTQNTHTAEAANLIVYGNLAGTGTPLARGLTLAKVQAPVWQTTGTNPLINTVTVKVSNYQFQPLVNTVFGVPLGPFTYSDITATMRAPL
ncbi:Flp pilus assembly protein TadG [Variovorax sp. PBL-H6]|uniref:TadE/TadG family type IV pilus assembly protein n=1 Tax=Variovorax sp. PBL-H6 TaxID=434009 RepID=UPI001317D402|nr:TadE/TadG family type IV pilus assembly protein [Variovorax sp. PBL-H6]VTU22040.1 Flp pilus assembly protein TadG [Variovorax sp. PBL-H6]